VTSQTLHAYTDNGVEARIGDIITSFRGEQAILLRLVRPRKDHRTGKVYVRFIGSHTGEYYDTVFNLRVTDIEDKTSI
jgi:hypothetical protein